ncbi:MAG TPA: hypothetical protein VG737_11315, partial [Cyclobacteriaceae bacterium]|nr:hypothetical protein [Cyclobacteriaceae bacterium]
MSKAYQFMPYAALLHISQSFSLLFLPLHILLLMITSYFRIALRYLLKNKVYSIINTEEDT